MQPTERLRECNNKRERENGGARETDRLEYEGTGGKDSSREVRASHVLNERT